MSARIFIFSALLVLCSSWSLSAAEWTNSVDDALSEAEKSEKDVLVIFTSAGMQEKPKYESYRKWWQTVIEPGLVPSDIQEKFVVVQLDVPSIDEKMEDEAAQRWREKLLSQTSGYPRTFLLDAMGRPYYSLLGYSIAGKDWWSTFLSSLAIRERRDEALKQAANSTGVEKAEHLDRALDNLFEWIVHQHYRPEVDEIIELDADNGAELRNEYLARRHVFAAEQTPGRDQTKRIIAAIDFALEEYSLAGQAAQDLLVRKAMLTARTDKPTAIAIFQQALIAAPEGKQVLRIKGYLKFLNPAEKVADKPQGNPPEVAKVRVPRKPAEELKGKILIDASKDGGAWWYPQGKSFDENEQHQGKPLADILRAKGFTVKELARGVTITPELLGSVELVLRPRLYSQYQASEIDAYEEAIRAGLYVLIMAEPKSDKLCEKLGFDIGPAQVLGNITSSRKHSLAQGLTDIEGQWATIENMPKDATSLASLASGRSVAAVRPLDKGLIMVIGSSPQQSGSVIKNLVIESTSKPATDLIKELEAAKDELHVAAGPKAPQPVSPAEGALLPQGIEATWKFEWSAPDDAVEFELIVSGARAKLPFIRIKTKETSYEKSLGGGRIVARNKQGWTWSVRAKDAQGKWGIWSTNRKFDVE